MRILVIEDDERKTRDIEAEILSSYRGAVISVVTSLAEAVRSTMTLGFDLIVLDLMLPYLADTPAVSGAGYEMLRQVRRSGPNKYTKIISLSAFPDEVGSYRARFDEMAVLITTYDDEGGWRSTLRGTLSEVSANKSIIEPIDFLIVCALDEERAGFTDAEFDSQSDVALRNLNIRYVKRGEHIGAILRQSQMGLSTAIYETAVALQHLDPTIICMTGICAGFDGRARLGQIVAASLAWEYQAGKWAADGFEIAPLQVPMPAATRSVIDKLFDEPEFAERIDNQASLVGVRPGVVSKPMIAPMASGSAVIAEASRLEHIKAQHRKVAALDMETFGVFYAAHERAGRVKHFFSIKCVVDLADSSKGDSLHQYGARASALTVIDILDRLVN